MLQRGEVFFSEVANFLHNLRMSCAGPFSEQCKNIPGFVKNICKAEDILKQEETEFKVSFKTMLSNSLLNKVSDSQKNIK